MKGALALLAAGLVVSGCGGNEGGATPALRETADRLGTIRSGVITFSMEVDPRGDDEPFGFELQGPFELAEGGKLPRADIEYTQTANGQSETVRLVSDGERAVAVAGGRTVQLEGDALEDLREGGAAILGSGAGDGEGLEELRIDRWLVGPELSDGPDGTDKIEGELDVVEVANGLLELVGSIESEGGAPRLDVESGDQLREAVKSSEFELLTGEDDRLLRRLALAVEVAADVPEELREALGEVVGADFSFLLELERPNEPVDVALP